MTVFQPGVKNTVDQYYQLPEEIPFRLINGQFVQTMGASLKHQEILLNIAVEIKSYIRQLGIGKVFVAPTDVVLGDANVFQPDILFISVARQQQMQINRIIGAPEFVIEILSHCTQTKVRTTKMTQYGLYDVLEYWIVNPTVVEIEVYYNHERTIQLVQTAQKGDRIVSKAIEGFSLDVDRVF